MKHQEYLENIKKLNLWAKAYYTNDTPLVSDDEYDRLYHQVLEFEKEYPSLKCYIDYRS